mgnify:CR=1 FL=1
MYFAFFFGTAIVNGITLFLKSTMFLSLSSQKTSIGKKTKNMWITALNLDSFFKIKTRFFFFENIKPLNFEKKEVQKIKL